MRSPLYEYHVPLFSTTFCCSAASSRLPEADRPVPNMISSSARRNGGATLFLTTLMRMRLPIAFSPVRWIVSILRTSRRTEE